MTQATHTTTKPYKCDGCPIRVQCNECCKEMTCEEFKIYIKERENDREIEW